MEGCKGPGRRKKEKKKEEEEEGRKKDKLREAKVDLQVLIYHLYGIPGPKIRIAVTERWVL